MATKSKTPVASTKTDVYEADELIALARLDVERGHLDEALWKLKQAQTDAAAPPEVFAMLARLYAQLGLWDRAKPLFERFLAVEPQAVNESFQLGMVHFDSGHADEAVKIWDKLLLNQPTHPPALFYRALAKQQLGNPGEARQSLDALLRTAPPDNLYFARAKELLQAMEAQPVAGRSGGGTMTSVHAAPKDPYKTEH